MRRRPGDCPRVFALSSVAALAIASKVERAVVSYLRPADPLVAGLERIHVQLEAIRDRLPELTASAHDLAELEAVLRQASARIEEWTA
jgi:hypothetical protein